MVVVSGHKETCVGEDTGLVGRVGEGRVWPWWLKPPSDSYTPGMPIFRWGVGTSGRVQSKPGCPDLLLGRAGRPWRAWSSGT